MVSKRNSRCPTLYRLALCNRVHHDAPRMQISTANLHSSTVPVTLQRFHRGPKHLESPSEFRIRIFNIKDQVRLMSRTGLTTQPNASPAPCHPNQRLGVLPEQSKVQGPDPRRAGQHVPSSPWGNQGTAPRANHYGVPGDNRTWHAGNGATHPQAPYPGFPYLQKSGNTWRTINGLH